MIGNLNLFNIKVDTIGIWFINKYKIKITPTKAITELILSTIKFKRDTSIMFLEKRYTTEKKSPTTRKSSSTILSTKTTDIPAP